MAYLFHQNLCRYGGGADARNFAIHGAFAGVRLSRSAKIKVAGFTEVTNSVTAGNTLEALQNDLMEKPLGGYPAQNIIVVKSGQSIAGIPEYIAIGVHSTLQVLEVGRTYTRGGGGGGGGAVAQLDVAPGLPGSPGFHNWFNLLPKDGTADYRGIVYTRVYDGGTKKQLAVGFVHNLYRDEVARGSFMQLFPSMLDLIANRCQGNLYIGGDFNVPPTDRKAYRTYSAGLSISPRPSPPAAFTPGGTLMSGNLFDYWYSNINKNDRSRYPAPDVAPTTLGPDVDLSDHCGILLAIDDLTP